MIDLLIQMFATVIATDIEIWFSAKGMQTEYSKDDFSSKLLSRLLKRKKETKIHRSVIFCNLALYGTSFLLPLLLKAFPGDSFFTGFVSLVTNIQNNITTILIGIVVFIILTAISMVASYYAVPVIPSVDARDGSRSLTAKDINREYIEFSKIENIDARSELLLIAGDLSFLGNIPMINSIRDKRQRKRCTKSLNT